MIDDLAGLSAPLTAADIDFRIQSINKGGYATILAYKDARVDINRLNSVVGRLGWKREHTNSNHNCIVSIWDDVNKQWVGKEDTGTESLTEKEKGLASDSFKRSCFNWGVGIELYDYPVISVKLEDNEFTIENGKAKQTWNLKLRDWSWRVDVLDRVVTYLIAKDQNGNVRFVYGSAARRALIENQSSVDFIIEKLTDNDVNAAAEAWYEMEPSARRDLYIAEKHGGPFTTQQRQMMKDLFKDKYPGGEWNEGLFSVVDV